MVGLIDQNKLGARVRVGQDTGTIRYSGNVKLLKLSFSSCGKLLILVFLVIFQVEGHEGMWIGVEWDDPSRGRHNGTVNGHFYFETK
jgi:hypothetical protein